MRRAGRVVLSVFLFLSLCGNVCAEEAEKEPNGLLPVVEETESLTEDAQDRESEWNVLLYLCGTDLESEGGSATHNLNAIAASVPNDHVNFLVETGGAKRWDPKEKLGFEIANDRLQRWYYGDDGFVLVDEAEDANMADGRTLSEFIRWGTENYRAKKNMLILWDHGGGSSKGMIMDENYGSPIMPLYMLEEALREGGTHFDLLMTDMCLMASLEMCQAVAPCADYLVASEEIMGDDGTDYESWVQYLYDRPECSPVQLGKRICDYTQQYYMESNQKDAVGNFTMSLIDLSKTDAVAKAFNTFMHEVSELVQEPDAFYEYAMSTYYAENYYLNTMYDLFDLSRRAEGGGISVEATYELQDAIEEAVLYNLRSENHMYSHGLSAYYALNDSPLSLDHFARTCKNPEHLAFLDCINTNWDAPAWVYQEVERYPELDRSGYQIVPDISFPEDGSRVYLELDSGYEASSFLSYELYYKDQETRVLYTLGESGSLIPEFDEEQGTYRFVLDFNGTWPSIDGEPLCMSIVDDTESYILYNVPVEVYGMKMQMRILMNYDTSDQQDDSDADRQEDTRTAAETEPAAVQNEKDNSPYQLLGLWDGFNAHTGLPGRNVYPLKEINGSYVTLFDAVYSNMLGRISDYIASNEIQITKDTVIERESLPEGEYMVRFIIRDVFNNIHYSDYVSLYWDKETVSYYKK